MSRNIVAGRRGSKSKAKKPARGPLKSLDLPSLKVSIFREGELVEVEEYPDPRAMFVATFNEQGSEFGLRAEPWEPEEPEDCRIALCRQHDVDDLQIVRIVKFGDSPWCSLKFARGWIAETTTARAKDGLHAVILPPNCIVRGPEGGAL